MSDEINMSMTIEPKSDQINADDLTAGSRTITITGIKAQQSSAEQPVAISFEGDKGKPWKPCKSMRRVLVHAWGPDGNAYVGRRLTLYRDDRVMWGGIQVGGIRISHMSDITKNMTMPLTVSKAKRAPFTVEPLRDAPSAPPPEAWAANAKESIDACTTMEKLIDFWKANNKHINALPEDIAKELTAAKDAKKVDLEIQHKDGLNE